MSLKTQRRIRFIPILNLITLIFLFKTYGWRLLKNKNFIKVMLMMFGVILATNIPRLILHLIFENAMLTNILYPISLYAMLLGLSWIAVYEQEKMQNG